MPKKPTFEKVDRVGLKKRLSRRQSPPPIFRQATKAEIKKRNEEQLKVLKGILVTITLSKDVLELNNTPAKRKRNVSIATKIAEEVFKQNKITGETIGKIFR